MNNLHEYDLGTHIYTITYEKGRKLSFREETKKGVIGKGTQAQKGTVGEIKKLRKGAEIFLRIGLYIKATLEMRKNRVHATLNIYFEIVIVRN